MRVEEIDARTAPDEVLLELHEVETACLRELDAADFGRTADESIRFYRFQPETHTSCHWGTDGGFASLYVHGPTAAFAHVFVDPARRRQGAASALVAAMLERCREFEVRNVHAQHATPAGAAFAHGLGAKDGQRIVLSRLDLRAANLAAPEPADGWALVTWLARVPDEHLDAFVLARAGMDDAPSPEELDFPTTTAEKVRASEASLARREREMRVTVAIRESGEIGAFTELRISEGATVALTDDTATVAEHRGKGLARAVKVESLARLREDHPEVVAVTTSNAEENAAMRHINTSIGFRPALTLTTSTLAL